MFTYIISQITLFSHAHMRISYGPKFAAQIAASATAQFKVCTGRSVI